LKEKGRVEKVERRKVSLAREKSWKDGEEA
jgi:hypothetical protein